MTHAQIIAAMSYPEYVAFERSSDERHEYIAGRVYPMAGGTPRHGALAANLIRALGTALLGRPCQLFTSDVRVRIPDTKSSMYPDASVVCGALETDVDDPHAITNPVVLVEVLSASTEAYDRGAKAAHYRRITSLKEYVLLAQDEARVEVYRRLDEERWELSEARAGARIMLPSIDVALDVAELYRDPLQELASAEA